MDKEIIRRADLLGIAGHDTTLKRVSDCNGGEWAGGCPMAGCGGTDRFRVQPFAQDGPRWFCRGCGDGKWHDAADYLMKMYGCTFPQALERLGAIPTPAQAKRPDGTKLDRSAWVSAGFDFIEASKNHLIGPEGEKAMGWLAARGLKPGTLEEFMIGFNPDDQYQKADRWGFSGGKDIYLPKGIIIPNYDQKGLHGIKIRQPVKHPKYLSVRGSQMWIYGAATIQETKTAFLFESEFDALLGHQTTFGMAYLSIPAAQKIRAEYEYIFAGLDEVLIMPDNDLEGMKYAENLDRLPGFHLAPVVPSGKDLGEYFQAGGDVFDWLYYCVGLLDEGKCQE